MGYMGVQQGSWGEFGRKMLEDREKEGRGGARLPH